MSHFVRESVVVNGKPLTFETGRLAKQAHGSVLVTYGDSVVLVTAVSRRRAPRPRLLPAHLRLRREDVRGRQDPGRLLQARRPPARRRDPHLAASWIARSARSSPRATRTTRRSSRPCSRATRRTRPTSSRSPARSAALHISDIPWSGPIVGDPRRRASNGEFIAFPTFEQQTQCDIDLVVACSQGRDRDGRGRRRRGDRERRHRRAHVRAQDGAADPRAHREACAPRSASRSARSRRKTLAGRHQPRVAALVDDEILEGRRSSRTRRRATTATRRLKKKIVETLTARARRREVRADREAHQGRVRGAQGPRRPQLRAHARASASTAATRRPSARS